MKEIPLTQDKVALVDDEDYQEISKHKWHTFRAGHLFYAARSINTNGGKYPVKLLMHAVILNTPRGFDTDHINGDGLDNRRANIRVVTRRTNQQNQTRHRNGAHPGIFYDRECPLHPFHVQIYANGKRMSLGRHATLEDAINKYNSACAFYGITIPS